MEAAAPEAEWPDVKKVLHQQAVCLQCHGFGGEKHHDVPLETHAEVKAVAEPGRGIPLGTLLTSAHNHVFAFGALALLLGLATAFTGLPGLGKAGLVLGAFLGALSDVAGWFLTRFLGDPFPYLVMAGGAAFGLATGLMALAVLDEAALGGRLAARFHLAARPRPAPDGAGTP